MGHLNGAMPQRHFAGWRFEPTITLGTVIHVVSMAILLVAFWIHVSDRLQTLEDYRAEQQALYEKELGLIQSMQINQAQQSVIIQNLDRRMNIVEQVDGLDGSKR